MFSFAIKSVSAMALLVIILYSARGIKSQQCFTSDNGRGTCVPLDECPTIASLLREVPLPWPPAVESFVQRAFCGYVDNKLKLCCPRPNEIVPEESPNLSPGRAAPVPASVHRNINLLPTATCGPFTTTKLAGGEKTEVGSFPWMALLAYSTAAGVQHLCAGSIINKRYILTAAHCVRSSLQLRSIVLGEHDTRTDPDCLADFCSYRREVSFERIIPHENYNNPRLANDIALIRLSEDIQFNEFIQPVCLPYSTELIDKAVSKLIVSGWGTTDQGMQSPELLAARMQVIPMDTCRQLDRRANLNDNQLCVVGEGVMATCKGDSGGPLVFPTRNSQSLQFVQYGIVSAGSIACGGGGEARPGVTVRLQSYRDWILDNMQQ